MTKGCERAPRRPWTPDEDALVRRYYARGKRRTRWEALSAALPHRTRRALWQRAKSLGIVSRGTRWTQAEIATLRREWGEVGRQTLAAKLPNRTWGGIVHRARVLGLPSVPQGWVWLPEAARRAGYTPRALLRILAWADAQEKARRVAGGHPYDADALGVPTRQHTATRKGRATPRPWLLIEWDACERAIERWVRLETTADAARRLGLDKATLARWLVRAGTYVRAKCRGRRVIRLDPSIYDQVARANGHRAGGQPLATHAARLGLSIDVLTLRLARAAALPATIRGRRRLLTAEEVDVALARWTAECTPSARASTVAPPASAPDARPAREIALARLRSSFSKRGLATAETRRAWLATDEGRERLAELGLAAEDGEALAATAGRRGGRFGIERPAVVAPPAVADLSAPAVAVVADGCSATTVTAVATVVASPAVAPAKASTPTLTTPWSVLVESAGGQIDGLTADASASAAINATLVEKIEAEALTLGDLRAFGADVATKGAKPYFPRIKGKRATARDLRGWDRDCAPLLEALATWRDGRAQPARTATPTTPRPKRVALKPLTEERENALRSLEKTS